MAAGSIVIDILAKTASFETDTARAAKSLEKFRRQAQDTARGIGDSFRSIAAAAGLTLSFAGFSALTKGAIDAADHLNDLSQKTGVAVDVLGGVGFAASQAGGDLESATAAIGKLNKSIAEAAAGNRDAADAFSRIGVAVKDASGNARSADQVFVDVANRFAGWEDGPNKAAIALKLFSKAGANAIPLLNEGGAALQKNIDYYRRYAGITTEVAKASDEFNDTIGKSVLISGAFTRTLAAELLPALQAIADKLLVAKESGTAFQTAAGGIKTVFETLTVLGANVAFVFGGVGREIGAVGAQIAALGRGDFEGFSAISEAVKEDGKRALAELTAFESRVMGLKTGRRPANEGGGGLRSRDAKTPAPRLRGDGDKDAERAASAYEKLAISIGHATEAAAAEIEGADKLTDIGKARLTILDALSDKETQFSDSQRASLAAIAASLPYIDEQLRLRRLTLEVQAHSAAATLQTLSALDSERQSRAATTNGLREQIAEYGLTGDAVESLRLKTLNLQAADEEAAATTLANIPGMENEVAAMRLNAAALRDQVALRQTLQRLTRRDEQDPFIGATRALDEYLEKVKNAGEATRGAVSQGLSILEQDGVDSLATGKLSVKSFVDYAIREIYRLAVVRPLLAQIFGNGNGAAAIGALASMFSGGYGGDVNGPIDPAGYNSGAGLATGTNYVPQDMWTKIHKGEAVVPKPYNPAAGGRLGGDVHFTLVNNTGVPARQRTERQGDGGYRVFLDAVKDSLIDDVGQGGRYSRAQENVYGSRRAPQLVR